MIFISGSSPKQQSLGQRNEPCPACRQMTLHSLKRFYRVRHIFWFPLFSTGTTYAKVCERCQLASPMAPPDPGTVPSKPFLHRLGFLLPVGVFFFFPLLLMPLALLAGGGHGVGSGAGAQAAGVAGDDTAERFFTAEPDRAAQSALQADFNDLGLRGVSVSAKSASANTHNVRLLTAQYFRLKNVSDGDRVRLLERMEAIADANFADDEVFVGLRGRVLWGGRSHRKAGEKWHRLVDESTPSPEADARAALRALDTAPAAAAPTPAAP
jgi:hypothetical protein